MGMSSQETFEGIDLLRGVGVPGTSIQDVNQGIFENIG
jgi:hypothetical protein